MKVIESLLSLLEDNLDTELLTEEETEKLKEKLESIIRKIDDYYYARFSHR